MLILAFDTTMTAMSVAIYDANQHQNQAHRYEVIGRGHAESLPEMIQIACAQADVAFSSFDRLAVTNGPGSFTGVRVGLAMARGLALGLNKPLVAVTSLSLIAAAARAAHPGHPVLVASDARRDEVFIAGYNADGTEFLPACAMANDALSGLDLPINVVIAGSARHLLLERENTDYISADSNDLPDAALIGPLAALLPLPETTPKPLYLRPPDAKPQARQITRQNACH